MGKLVVKPSFMVTLLLTTSILLLVPFTPRVHAMVITQVDWWWMFHHDLRHTGYSTSTAPSTNKTIWSYTTGGSVGSSPAVADGRVYVGSADNKVYCLDAASGSVIWSYTTGFSVYSSPAVADGRVYVGSYDDKVYCLDAYTGRKIWSYTTGDVVASSPAVADGRVYVGSHDNKVYCFGPPPCVIAIATYGSELASEVVFLRALRDVTFSSTFVGGCLVPMFNRLYYSSSPPIARFISNHPTAREITKLALYPFMGIMHLASAACDIFSFNPELGVVAALLTASSLVGVVYLSPLMMLSLVLVRRLRRFAPRVGQLRPLAILWLTTLALMLLGGMLVSPTLMTAATAAFALATLSLSGMITATKVVQLLP